MHTSSSVLLSDMLYYHIGGLAQTLCEVTCEDELLEVLSYIRDRAVRPVYFFGFGANVVPSDNGLKGLTVLFKPGKNDFRLLNNGMIQVFAGATLDSLIPFAFSQHLTGLGWAGGLPSSIGGAVRGNAGCFGHEIREYLYSVNLIDTTDPELSIQTFSNMDCMFGYRDSIFKHKKEYVIVSAVFHLASATSEQLELDTSVYHKNIAYRATHHPMEYPSCGSVFKNIVSQERIAMMIAVWPDMKDLVTSKWYGKVSMAYVIGRLGFANFRIGGAQVSQKHTNYISNVDRATAADVTEIITAITNKFTQTFGFVPELEVEIIK